MDDIYKNSEEYSPNKKHKILIIFVDVIPEMLSNEKVTELFIRGRDFRNFMNRYKKSTAKPHYS